uniref:Uncharacterized protein n=1 Tax=Micrurus corallinus TaxID=54390 RepID=A0A2D4FMZ7_MICCO
MRNVAHNIDKSSIPCCSFHPDLFYPAPEKLQLFCGAKRPWMCPSGPSCLPNDNRRVTQLRSTFLRPIPFVPGDCADLVIPGDICMFSESKQGAVPKDLFVDSVGSNLRAGQRGWTRRKESILKFYRTLHLCGVL